MSELTPRVVRADTETDPDIEGDIEGEIRRLGILYGHSSGEWLYMKIYKEQELSLLFGLRN